MKNMCEDREGSVGMSFRFLQDVHVHVSMSVQVNVQYHIWCISLLPFSLIILNIHMYRPCLAY